MWNSKRSLKLSLICTKVFFTAGIVFAVFLPKLLSIYMEESPSYSDFSQLVPLMIGLYLCCLPALLALFLLDKLLVNINQHQVFILSNIKYLRTISWCCIAVAVLICSLAYYHLIFIIVGAIVAFFGLIVRVIKNVMYEAMMLKEENDFTI